MSDAEQAVVRTLHQYIAACNARDVEAYKATLTSDAVFLKTTGSGRGARA